MTDRVEITGSPVDHVRALGTRFENLIIQCQHVGNIESFKEEHRPGVLERHKSARAAMISSLIAAPASAIDNVMSLQDRSLVAASLGPGVPEQVLQKLGLEIQPQVSA